MKTLIIYYSYTSHTKDLAHKLAAKEAVDIVEIKDIKRPNKLKAYTAGCIAAMRGKAWPINPLEVNLAKYNSLILLSPTWAGNPPPAVYALLEKLPKSKKVSVKMISASGKSKCKERLEKIIKAKGCTLNDYVDIKA